MSFIKRLIFCLALFGFIFGNPGFSNAGQPPSIVTAEILEPIVSVDGLDIQQADVVVFLPKDTLNPIADIDIEISTPDITDSLVGKFIWDAATKTFSEDTSEGSGSEFVDLIQPDPNNPDTTSKVTYNRATHQMTLTFRWTLDRSLGSTFDNDMNVVLDLKPATAFLLQPVFADSEVIIDSSFDTNTPPDITPIDDFVVLAEVEDVDVTIEATDVDSDPIVSYVFLESPSTSVITDNNFFWDPGQSDIGAVESVQFVVNDPYGATDAQFLISVVDEPVAETGSWTIVSTANAPDPRVQHSLVWTGSDVIVWGGSTADELAIGTGASYNVVSDTWTAIAPTLNGYAAQGHSAVWTGSEMIVWGGLTADGTATNVGQIYDPATDSWSEMSTVDAPSARYGAASVWTGSEMIVWGGAATEGGINWLSDGAKYDPVSDTWTALPGSDLEGRQDAAATFDGTQMLIWGGSSWSPATGTVYYVDGATYDPINDSWSSFLGPAAEGRVGNAAINVLAGKFLVWGGQTATGYSNTGEYYDLVDGFWSAINSADAPTARQFMAYGGPSESGTLIVWGGVDSNNLPLADGGVFDQETGSWLATATLNAPSARQLSKSVWIDSGLFVWGGLSSGPVFENTGGIFSL